MVIQHPQDPEAESFAGLLLRHRGRTGLTQRDLAARLGTNRRSVQDWESSAYHPSAERLKALILVLLESGRLEIVRLLFRSVHSEELRPAGLAYSDLLELTDAGLRTLLDYAKLDG